MERKEEERRLALMERDQMVPILSTYKDTAILVQSEVHHLPSACEEISLDLNGSPNGFHNAFKYGRGDIQPLDSPSECTTLSTISTATVATPLDQKHRYHLFFASHKKDRPWVDQVVEKLESDSHNYRCCLAERDFDTADSSTYLQNILCSVMLSHYIVVVLTPHFVKETWPDYEEGLAHLMSLTLRKQRVIPILLEECEVPDSLRMLQAVDVRHGDFWDSLFIAISVDGIPCSDSLHTIRSLTSSMASGYSNGQLLTKLTATIDGMCRSRLLFDYEEVPDSLISQDVSFTRQEFAEIVKVVGREDHGSHLSWLFTALPTLLLSIVFVLWCVAFILVIILFPDNSPGTLPVRLCVFSLPAVFIVFGCVFRWRRLKQHKERFSICMFSRSVQVNKLMYQRSQPVILTTARTNEDTFQIFFIYFNLNDCIERIKIFLTHCTNEDIIKLNKLIEVYTLHSTYLDGAPIAARLAVMMSAAYGIQLIFKRIPHALEQRHTRRRQCLCQFVEEFLAAYLPCIRQEAEVGNLRFIFLRYLNCQFRPDPVILHTLGIQLMQC